MRTLFWILFALGGAFMVGLVVVLLFTPRDHFDLLAPERISPVHDTPAQFDQTIVRACDPRLDPRLEERLSRIRAGASPAERTRAVDDFLVRHRAGCIALVQDYVAVDKDRMTFPHYTGLELEMLERVCARAMRSAPYGFAVQAYDDCLEATMAAYPAFDWSFIPRRARQLIEYRCLARFDWSEGDELSRIQVCFGELLEATMADPKLLYR